jgi:glyoxylase-like metal-dependent hydrolase (beta-lactamase superfamily II)
MSAPAADADLGWVLLQRDWLSANHVFFKQTDDSVAAVVDTGYARHSPLTLALIEQVLAGQALGRIVNTHLHSDHCGGNLALQARWPAQTLVPAASLEAVRSWDEHRLSYQPTGQHCERFRVDGSLHPGAQIRLGQADWQIHAAPGHDAEAVMLFEPQTRTLISGDALWEDRLAIIFPELDDRPGFLQTRQTLALVESLAPRQVLPGHGAAFCDVAQALAASRARLASFEAEPRRHHRHAARALLMFHMLEHRQQPRSALLAWLLATPIFIGLARRTATAGGAPAWAASLLDGLLGDGLLEELAGEIQIVAAKV